MTLSGKIRLDQLVKELGLAETRSKAQALIMSGAVLVDGEVRDKPGQGFPRSVQITLKEKLKYVSRGGLKLEAALDRFTIEVEGKVCLDVGSSTGGFTDCLLQRGASRVYAVDVGKGQLDWKLRNHERVTVMEGKNARELKEDDLPEPIGLAVMDVSFISLDRILPAVAPLLSERGEAVALVKPQFEAGRDQVQKGGVVRDPLVIEACVDRISRAALALGLIEKGRMPSPIKGPKGNQEYLLYLARQ